MSAHQGRVVIGHLVDEDVEWSLDEVCRLFAVERQWVVELIEQGVFESRPAVEPRFGGAALRRVRIAARLRRDLGVNAAGTALAIELMERIDELERELSSAPSIRSRRTG